jgi:branched-chain amino acid aminotransferase
MKDYVVSINGQIAAPDAANISVLDHGFLFGDSIYEVVRTVNGKLFAADRHLKRLHGSAAALEMPLQRDDEWLKDAWRALHKAREGGESYLRMIVTRGEGALDLHPATCASQNYIGIAKALNKWPDDAYAHGCKVILAQVQRNSKRSTDPAIKSGNYLNNVLAIMEARKHDATEAIMLNASGHLTECTTSNVFIVKNGVVKTPALEEGLLEGVTRGFILRVCADLHQPVEETQLTEEDLFTADEVFITSTTRDVMPVHFIGTHRVKRTPGTHTIRIANAYHDVLMDPANHS